MSAMNVGFVIFNLTYDSVLYGSTVREFFLFRSWSQLLCHMTDLFFGTPHAALNVETLVLYFYFFSVSIVVKRHLLLWGVAEDISGPFEKKVPWGIFECEKMKWEIEVLNPHRSLCCCGMVWLQGGLLWIRYELRWVDRQAFGRLILMLTFRKWVVKIWICFRLHYLW